MRASRVPFALLLAALTATSSSGAQEHGAEPSAAQVADTRPVRDRAMTEEAESSDMIMPHITDSHELEYPCYDANARLGFGVCHVELPHWEIDVAGKAIDVSPTKHVVFMLIAATLAAIALLYAAAKQGQRQREGRAPRGFAGMIEATVLYLRNEVIVPNVGPHGEAYHPFLLSIFFFILLANLLGLIPFGSTATGNIGVTATLAVLSFLVIEWAGIRALGWGYVKTIVYWPHDMPLGMRIPMTFIMTPVEIIGKFTKPFALAIRLFANMTAGHVMILALISMALAFGVFIGLAPVVMAIAIMMLELFVAFLQAYVFTLLSAAFIGQIRMAHH
jgi:F-type H+-transporting ATPase subunit a